MKLSCRSTKTVGEALLVVTLIAVILSISGCSKDDSSSSYLGAAEQRFISAHSYRISGEALLVAYYAGKSEVVSSDSMPFEMVVVNSQDLVTTSGYLDVEGMLEEVRKTNPSYLETVDPKAPFFLADNYIYEYRFERNSEERKWYKQRYYPALSFTGSDYVPTLHDLILVIGSEDVAEIEEENETSIKYRLLIGGKIKEILLEELGGSVSGETIRALSEAIDRREFDAYCEIDKETGLITHVELSIKPFSIEHRTSSDPLQGDLYIKADVYDYNENIKVELAEEARDAEELEDPLSSDNVHTLFLSHHVSFQIKVFGKLPLSWRAMAFVVKERKPYAFLQKIEGAAW
jgi:hypothetical protein